jgi:hypothetical protein
MGGSGHALRRGASNSPVGVCMRFFRCLHQRSTNISRSDDQPKTSVAMRKLGLRPRPPFAKWLFDRGISRQEAAGDLGVTSEWLRQITKPFDDDSRARPNRELRGRILAYTEGDIGPTDWEPAAEARAA